MTEWIKLDKEMPEEGKSVMLLHGKNMFIGFLENGDFYDSSSDDYMPKHWISHWMNLPELPRGEK